MYANKKVVETLPDFQKKFNSTIAKFMELRY